MRVLAIAMDAADSDLALRWAREGKLPTLGSLIDGGLTVDLSADLQLGPEAVWPTIVTGCLPGKHGIYNWRSIKPGTNLRVRTPHRTYRKPFWSVSGNGAAPNPALIVDVPYASRIAEDGVVQVLGWGQRGAARHESWPPDLLEDLRAEYGEYASGLDREHSARALPLQAATRQVRVLKRMAEVRTALLTRLIRERDWELCFAPYFEPHYAGHAFHRYLHPGQWGYDEGRARRLDTALLEVYAAVDRGIAGLIDAAGEDVTVLVFTGFGMRPNTNGLRVLDLVMEDLGYHARNAASSRARGLEAARRAALRTLPRSIGRAVKKRLPQGAVDRHLERLWLESTDWKRTRAYAESEPGHSFIRLAHPDRGDHDELCEEIADELGRLENAETGERAVDRVVRRDRIVFGPHAEKLPELSVIWNEKNMLLRVRHPRFGVVEEDLSELQPSEHVERGFLVASGPAVEARPEPIQGHVVDLAPTMLHLLGSRIPEEMDGRPLPLAPGLEPPARAAIDMDDDPWRER